MHPKGNRDSPHEAGTDVLLDVLLGKVLDVPLGEGDVGGDGELGGCRVFRVQKERTTRKGTGEKDQLLIAQGAWGYKSHIDTVGRRRRKIKGRTLPLEGDVVTEVSGLALNLDLVVQELYGSTKRSPKEEKKTDANRGQSALTGFSWYARGCFILLWIQL